MARKSEEWWAAHESPTYLRCTGTTRENTRCLAKAEDGSVVCKNHGAFAPQVRKRAAERILLTADAAAQNLINWMDDPSIPWGERVKIARDLMDRAGLVAAQVHKFHPAEADDPVEMLFKSILADPEGLSEPRALPGAVVVQGETVDHVQEAYEHFVDSHVEDAEVVPIEVFGKSGPYKHGGSRNEVLNGNPQPAAPHDERRWRRPDDAS